MTRPLAGVRRRRLPLLTLAPFLLVAALIGSSCVNHPGLEVRVLARGLTLPWDLTITPNGDLLFTERGGRITNRHANGQIVQVQADMADLFVGSETGLMGLVIDPNFNANRRVYTCQGYTSLAGNDVRVVVWTLSANGEALTKVGPLVTGMPLNEGRHGGCRLRFDRGGNLWIGTGDGARGMNPQNLDNLGGKVLRVNKTTGDGVTGNPFINSASINRRRLVSWGHRNVQGLALHPDGTMWTVEHGSDRDDEINKGVSGNFGWDPGGTGYDESGVPMTDKAKFPDAIDANWSSGYPTIATSGATWLTGDLWKGWNGGLAVANLKDTSLKIFFPDKDGKLQPIATVLDDTYGRLRTAQIGPNGHLFVTTSNGSGQDQILEVFPG
jgi:glucose/arabinose dehydrogenase